MAESRAVPPSDTPAHRRGRLFWPCCAAGWAIIAFGAWGLLRDARDTRPPSFVPWFAGSALVHDLLLAPVVFAVGVLLARTVPPPIRAWVQGVLVTSALVVAGSFPWVAGLGDRADNASLLPGNYVVGLLIVLAAVWLAGTTGALLSVRRARRGP